ncbi:MAG: hypothetical protein ABXS91_08535 [Sulfurimonas sp.]
MGELNQNLFVTFQDKSSGVMVRGRILSYSISDQAEWQNKFEGTDGDGKTPMLSAILQSGIFAENENVIAGLAGKTLITKAQSVQVWTGMQPQEITVEVEFRAFSNASIEVEQAIQALRKMNAPELKEHVLDATSKAINSMVLDKSLSNEDKARELSKTDALGDVPSDIAFSITQRRFNATYRIENISESVEELQIDRNGNRVYQVVSITLGSKAGIMKSDVKDGTAFSAIKELGETIDRTIKNYF